MFRTQPSFGSRFRFRSQQEQLHYRAELERMTDSPDSCIVFRGSFSHLATCNFLDLLSHRIGRTGKELSVKLLHLSYALRSTEQDLLDWYG
ncbi:hypothetical protein U8335_16940 [Roseiconus lacunae]|uniref:hypothetical protein n=1 Tax=Roseiconus lacunae TaxID=2605694 RepID=UPI00308F6643|nr:hypothetical protein U8335_16940 [Stieleria sp. HD01]